MKHIKTVLYFLITILLILHNNIGNAMPFSPLNFFFKPYIGVDFLQYGVAGGYDSVGLGGGIDRFKNFSLNTGLRIHKYFGVEFSYSMFNLKFTGTTDTMKFQSSNIGFDLLLYYPFFDIFGNALELYADGGITRMMLSIPASYNGLYSGTNSSINVFKCGGGLQARLFGSSSIRIGVDYYFTDQLKATTGVNGILLLKTGITIYFL